MPLKGKEPEAVQKRLKAMFFGPPSSGKTTAAIQFPEPYVVDAEKGAENEEYVVLMRRAGALVFTSVDFDEIVTEVTTLLREKHRFKTLVIDPITPVYDDLLEKAERKVGSEFGRHYGEANKRMKHLFNLLIRLDMNVIVTCHAKKEYGDGMSFKGMTFDGWKRLDYLFDLVFELQIRGNDRVGIVRKTRVSSFPEGSAFPFCYEQIAKRYGNGVIEREAVPEELATDEQVAEIKRLFDLLTVTEDAVGRWLTKHKAETLNEVPKAIMAKAIESYRKQAESRMKGEVSE